MSIHLIDVARDDSPSNVNPAYLGEDGNPMFPSWDRRVSSQTPYFLTPEVSSYIIAALAFAGEPLPPGYIYKKNEVLYPGRVVELITKNERIMSDVWEDVTSAIVYSPETKGTKVNDWSLPQETDFIRVHVRTAGDGTRAMGDALIDADPEIIERYHREMKERAAKHEAEIRAQQLSSMRQRVDKDKIVKVTRGRKVKVGTTGKVFWRGNNGYGDTVGIALTPRKGPVKKNGKTFESFLDTVFVSESNVDVVGSESDESLAAAVKAWEAL